MKKTIPLKKQLQFKMNINEITSISLENTLHNNQNNIEGELIINGTYKITDTSKQVEEFEFKIPVNIEIDEKYDYNNIIIDIEDFYYEIINNNTLDVNIEILLDNLVEKQIEKKIEEKREELKMKEENKKIENIEQTNNDERCIEEETKVQEKELEIKKDQKTIFDNYLNETDDYSTYYIYIMREGDTIDTILSKYNIVREKLEEYNNLNELKLGDKIIIPEKKDAGN